MFQLLALPRRSRYVAAALLLTAFLARVVVVLMLRGSNDAASTYEHGAIADNLLAGRGFSVWFLGTEGPTSQQAPWVPMLLAFCSWPWGEVTASSILTFQLLQCLAGTALVAVLMETALRWFPDSRSPAWIVGLAAACFPPHVYMATHVQVAPWAALGFATLLLSCPARNESPGRRRAVLAGLTLGWLLLVDPIFVLVTPVVVWQFALCSPSWRTAIYRLAAVAGCATLVVVPWLVRNTVVHGEFVFVKSTFGYAFWQGNHPQSHGTDKIPKSEAATLAARHDGSVADQHRALWEARHETLYIDDVLLKPDGYRQFTGLSEPARSRLLGEAARQYVADDPWGYVRRSLRRLRFFLLWDETNPKTLHIVYRWSSAAWLALAAVGLLAAKPHWRRLAPSMAMALVVTAFHALTITSARFRIPLEPLGLLWAAVGFAPALTNVGLRLIAIVPPLRLGRSAPVVGDSSSQPELRGPHSRRAGSRKHSFLRRR